MSLADGNTWLNGMYVEVNPESYNDSGSVEITGNVISGWDLYENMLEEEHGLACNSDTKNGYGYDIVSTKALACLLEAIGGKKGAVAGYLLNRRGNGNTMRITMKNLAHNVKASLPTVNSTVKVMREKGFLKKGLNAEYMISPHLIYRGKFSRAAYLGKVYENFDKFRGAEEGENQDDVAN